MPEYQTSTTSDHVMQISCFMLDNTLCGVEISSVQEINQKVQLTNVPLSDNSILGIMNLRGQIVTVVDQAIKMGLQRSKIDKDRRIIIVSSKGEHVGLMVDQIKDVIKIKTSAIETPPSNIQGVQGKFFKGVVKTDQNDLLALIDIERVLEDRVQNELR